jgi:hypothetical protein
MFAGSEATSGSCLTCYGLSTLRMVFHKRQLRSVVVFT